MSWVEQAAPIVHEVIRRVGRSDLKALRREFRKAYPFGPRTNAPYKAWLSEIRRQLGHPLNLPKCDPEDPQMEFELWAPVLLCELSDVSITAVERMERCQNVTPWSTGRSACRR